MILDPRSPACSPSQSFSWACDTSSIPKPAAAGFGIPDARGGGAPDSAWLAVKAARDIAVGIAIAARLIDGAHRQLGYLVLAASTIPLADGTIVLRAGGPKAIAYGVHWSTAAVMLTAAALLVI